MAPGTFQPIPTAALRSGKSASDKPLDLENLVPIQAGALAALFSGQLLLLLRLRLVRRRRRAAALAAQAADKAPSLVKAPRPAPAKAPRPAPARAPRRASAKAPAALPVPAAAPVPVAEPEPAPAPPAPPAEDVILHRPATAPPVRLSWLPPRADGIAQF
ncbi:hypothetical protein [Spirillospora sp. CA-294931]|uniref:hypothetical protein n=1 Tax=Spirillospora sp. CA-294931 TaxID=3240042 RepID=UPI003D8B943A